MPRLGNPTTGAPAPKPAPKPKLTQEEINLLAHLGYDGYYKAGSFYDSLFEAMLHAHPLMLAKMHTLFPEHVDAMIAWNSGELAERAGIV